MTDDASDSVEPTSKFAPNSPAEFLVGIVVMGVGKLQSDPGDRTGVFMDSHNRHNLADLEGECFIKVHLGPDLFRTPRYAYLRVLGIARHTVNPVGWVDYDVSMEEVSDPFSGGAV